MLSINSRLPSVRQKIRKNAISHMSSAAFGASDTMDLSISQISRSSSSDRQHHSAAASSRSISIPQGLQRHSDAKNNVQSGKEAAPVIVTKPAKSTSAPSHLNLAIYVHGKPTTITPTNTRHTTTHITSGTVKNKATFARSECDDINRWAIARMDVHSIPERNTPHPDKKRKRSSGETNVDDEISEGESEGEREGLRASDENDGSESESNSGRSGSSVEFALVCARMREIL